MSSRFAFLFMLFLLILNACNQNESLEQAAFKVNGIEEFEQIVGIPAKGETLPIEAPKTAFGLLSHDDYLIFCNGMAAPTFYEIYDTRSFEKVSSYGKEGNGPGEFVGVLRSSFNHQSKVLEIFSFNMGEEFIEVPFDSMLNQKDYVFQKADKIEVDGVNRVTKMPNGDYAVISTMSPQRLTVLDSTRSIKGSYFDYPFQESLSEVNPMVRGMIYQSFMTRHPEFNRIGLFTMSSTNWDIIEVNKDSVELINSSHLRARDFVDLSEIEEKFRSISVASTNENKNGFESISSNSEYIYALYSGKSYADNQDDFDDSDKVYIIDWEGRVVNKLILDQPANFIAVDQKNQYLYTVIETMESNVVLRYDLDEVEVNR